MKYQAETIIRAFVGSSYFYDGPARKRNTLKFCSDEKSVQIDFKISLLLINVFLYSFGSRC